MRIKADLLRVHTGPYAPTGERIEPEQQPAQRVLVTEFPTGMQGTNQQIGAVKGEIIYDVTVGEAAKQARHPCISCRNFDRRAWRKLYIHWSNPATSIEERKLLNGIRTALLETENAKISDRHAALDGDMDVEHALSVLGVCRPLTEINKDPVIVYPTGGCPADVCTPTSPDGLWVAKDLDAEKMGSSVFDNIMNTAQGRK